MQYKDDFSVVSHMPELISGKGSPEKLHKLVQNEKCQFFLKSLCAPN